MSSHILLVSKTHLPSSLSRVLLRA
jgi:hypothetical protein